MVVASIVVGGIVGKATAGDTTRSRSSRASTCRRARAST